MSVISGMICNKEITRRYQNLLVKFFLLALFFFFVSTRAIANAQSALPCYETSIFSGSYDYSHWPDMYINDVCGIAVYTGCFTDTIDGCRNTIFPDICTDGLYDWKKVNAVTTSDTQNYYSPGCGGTVTTTWNAYTYKLEQSCNLKITSFTGSGTTIDTNFGGFVSLTGNISDSSGQLIFWQATLPNGQTVSGSGDSVNVLWDGRDANGKVVDPGTYTITLNASGSGNSTCSDSKTATITITPIPGKDCTLQVTIGSSANVASGNLSHSQGLFSTNGAGNMPSVALFYNSQDPYNGPLGTGWVHNYDISLKESSNGSTVFLRYGNGTRKLYIKSGSDYTSNPGDYSTLVKNADGTFVITNKDGSKYNFGQDKKIVSIVDRNGTAMTFAYANSNLTAITDAAGRIITLSYDTANHITSITDPSGNVYSFTVIGNVLKSVTYPGSGQWSYTYDDNAFMRTKTDPNGNTTTYTYDSNHRVLSALDPQGQTKSVNYPSNADATKTTTFTEIDGGVWQYTYNTQAGTLTSKTDPNGNTTSYTYDQNRNMLTKTEPDGTTTSYAYDSRGNMLSLTDALGLTTSYSYNNFGQVTSLKDSPGNVTTYTYDARGNLITTTDSIGSTTQYQYDSQGWISSTTNASGQTTTYAYDQYGNIASITDPSGAVTKFTYDANGNRISQTDANNKTTSFEYNSQNQLVKTTDPNGNVTTFGYDKNGNRTLQVDANGNATYYEYNYKGQLIQVKDALGNITSYAYGNTDGAGCSSCGGGGDKLTALVDAKGNTTKYEYDTSGRLIKEIDALGNTIASTYNAKGNLILKIDANGNMITYTYDALDRLTTKTYPDNTAESYTYDAKGNILTAASKNISYTFTYDVNNRVTSVMDSNSRTIRYEYNTLGSKTKMTTPEGKALTYTYDDVNRLSGISAQNFEHGTLNWSYTYDSVGRRAKLSYPNGASANYIYDSTGRLTSLYHKTSKGHIIDSFNYTLDKVGNRLAKSGMNANVAYTYDAIYRLQQVTGSHHHGAEQFTYDPVGNRLTGPDDELAYTYNAGNQLTNRNRKERHDEEKNTEYAYDKNGNLVKKIKHDDDKGRHDTTTLYTYDYENRLIKIETQKHNKQTIVSFTYDPFGRRLSKTVERDEVEKDKHKEHGKDRDRDDHQTPRTTYFVYDNQDILVEYGQNGRVKTRYVHGLGIDEHLAIEKKDEVYYYHADGLGSIAALTDKKQNVVGSYTYSSFGELKMDGEKIEQPYAFTGREWDEEIGLYYYRARYYDAKSGRFISFDPIVHPSNTVQGTGCNKISLTPSFNEALKIPLKLNPFIYVMDNAVNLTDPTGLSALEGGICYDCNWSAIIDYMWYETRNDPLALNDVAACVASIVISKGRSPNSEACLKALYGLTLYAPDALNRYCRRGITDDCNRCVVAGAQ